MNDENELSQWAKSLISVLVFIGAVLVLIGFGSKNYLLLAIGAGLLLLLFILWIRSISRYLDSTVLDTHVKSKNIPALIKLLRKNPSVRGEVKPRLIKLGEEATRLCIIEAEKANEKVKPHFLDIIAGTKNPKGLGHLIHALQSSDKDIRIAAIKGLGNLKNPSAVKELSKQLQAGDSQIVKAAIEALGQIGTPEAELQILSMTERSNDLKISAIKALRNSNQEQVVQAVKALWRQGEDQVKTEAAISLSAYPDIDTETLFDLLEVHKGQKKIILPVINSLGLRRDPKAYKILTRFSESDSVSIAAAAIDALGEYPREETVTFLKKFTELDNPQVLHSVIRALCKIQSKPAIESVFKLFEYWGYRDVSSSYAWKREAKNADIAKFAITELGKKGNPQVLKWLQSIVVYANYDYVKRDIEKIIRKQKNILSSKKNRGSL
jgi:HEAT repeat protein